MSDTTDLVELVAKALHDAWPLGEGSPWETEASAEVKEKYRGQAEIALAALGPVFLGREREAKRKVLAELVDEIETKGLANADLPHNQQVGANHGITHGIYLAIEIVEEKADALAATTDTAAKG